MQKLHLPSSLQK